MNTPEIKALLTVLAILLIASLAALVLRKLLPGHMADDEFENLKDRIVSWWWMVGILAACFAIGGSATVWLCAFLSFMALREFMTVIHTRPGDHWAMGLSFFLFLPLQYLLVGYNQPDIYLMVIPALALLALPISIVLAGETTDYLQRATKIQWGLMICVYSLSHLPALLTLDLPNETVAGQQLLIFYLIVVQGSDVLQYVWGKWKGRRKLAPAISPSKTWEGLIGGVVCASLLGACLWWLTPFSVAQALLIALVCCVMGFLGGLVMSAIKREHQVKDWGHSISGHGGVLDRLDSICFSAPVFYHLVRMGWAG